MLLRVKKGRRMDDDFSVNSDGSMDVGGDTPADTEEPGDDDQTADSEGESDDTETDETGEGGDDADTDLDSDTDSDTDADADSDALSDDAGAIEHLLCAYQSQVQFGASPATMAYLKRSGLLAGTGMGSMGMESLTGSQEGLNAGMEDLKETITAKVKAWVAKAMEKASAFGSKISELVAKAGTYLKGKAIQIKENVKANPYAWAAGAVVALAAIAGVVAVATGVLDVKALSKASGIQGAFEKVRAAIGKIKMPGLPKIDLTLKGSRVKLVGALKSVPGKVVASKDWTAEKLKAVVASMVKNAGTLKTNVVAFGKGVADFGRGFASTFIHGAGTTASRVGLKGAGSAMQKTGIKLAGDSGIKLKSALGAGAFVGAFTFAYGLVLVLSTLIGWALAGIINGILRLVHSITGGSRSEAEV